VHKLSTVNSIAKVEKAGMLCYG